MHSRAQPPVPAAPDLLTTAEGAFEHAFAQDMPGLAAHTLAGFCTLRLPSTASITEQRLDVTKPEEASQTTCTAVRQPPVQAPPDLLTTAQAAFDLAVAHGMPRAHKRILYKQEVDIQYGSWMRKRRRAADVHIQ